MDRSHCTKQVNHSKIKVEENKQKAVFRNELRHQYDVSQVDGCIIDKGTTSADFLVSKAGSVSVLVELKGTDVAHACDQLLSTVVHENVKPLLEEKIGFLVICSRYPRFDSFVARAKQKCARIYKAGFHVVANQSEFDIERIAAIDGPD